MFNCLLIDCLIQSKVPILLLFGVDCNGLSIPFNICYKFLLVKLTHCFNEPYLILSYMFSVFLGHDCSDKMGDIA